MIHMLSFLIPIVCCIGMLHDEKDNYVYEPIKRSTQHNVGKRNCLGTIDADGCFRPDLSELEEIIESTKRKLVRTSIRSAPLTTAKQPNEKVYEYRSGILVPMIFDEYRGLIPEAGGKIIDFKDYRYSPEARRIYNLPGRFVQVPKYKQ
ncbi:MAG: hypothetical protein JNJ77_21735 [Planctomycetia bacterium]|nr:hypothetical protein [Planctomycetia bacterium]